MGESARTRLFVCLAAVVAVLACLPASAAGYGTNLTDDDTTAYEFGWSADRQASGGNPLPITLQYHKDQEGVSSRAPLSHKPMAPTSRCGHTVSSTPSARPRHVSR